MAPGLNRVYLATVVLLMLLAPVASIAVETGVGTALNGWDLAAKWFAFWAAGIRLLAAGIRQTLQPAFTARTIFGMADASAYPLVREIGMANVSMGLLGVASLWMPGWRLAAALVACAYFGLAAAGHLVRRPQTSNEAIALVSDVFIFIVFAAILLHAILHQA